MVKAYVGTNHYLLKRSVSELKSRYLADNGEMSVEEIDCEDSTLDALDNALKSVPLFAQNKLVIAENIQANKILAEQIEDIFESAKESNELVIVERKIDKRSGYYKFLKKNSELNEFNEIDEYELIKWLLSEAEVYGATLNRRDAGYLVQRVGLNQQELSKELEKLAAYDKNISRENIDQLTDEKPQSSIFNLLDAAFDGNTSKTLRIYSEQRSQGSEPQSIFGMIVWQANQLATVAACGNKNESEIAKITGLKPFSISKALGIIMKTGSKGVGDLLDNLVYLDKQLKTKPVEADELVRNLLITINK